VVKASFSNSLKGKAW